MAPPPPPFDPYGGYPIPPVPMPAPVAAPAPLPAPSSYVPVQVILCYNYSFITWFKRSSLSWDMFSN